MQRVMQVLLGLLGQGSLEDGAAELSLRQFRQHGGRHDLRTNRAAVPGRPRVHRPPGLRPVYGARPLRRFIAREVETPVARALVAGDVRDGAVIKVGLTDGQLAVSYDNLP
jgi:hypothetical protein